MAKSPAAILVDETGRVSSMDAFVRLRVSQPFSLFYSKQVFDNNPQFFEERTTGGGSITWVKNKAASELKTTTASGDEAIRQTKQYFNYQPGKGLFTFASFNLRGLKTNVRMRAGYFEAGDGIFLQADGTEVSLIRRTSVSGSPVDNKELKANWSIDKMDGSGPSGVDLDWTKGQILFLDLQWLGMGEVRVGFLVGGKVVYCHEFHHANILDTVYMRTSNLPVRWEITNTGTATGTPQFDAICCTVMAEGGIEERGTIRSADREANAISISTAIKPVIAIRLKASHNRAAVVLKKASIMSSTGANFYWQLVINPTITGGAAASWTDRSDAMQFDVTRDGVVSDGVVIDSGYVSNNADQALIALESALTITADFEGVVDELVLAVRTINNPTENFLGAITWMEVI